MRAARAQLEGLEEAESGEEAEEEVSSGGEGSEQEGAASDGAGGAAVGARGVPLRVSCPMSAWRASLFSPDLLTGPPRFRNRACP